MKKNNIIAEKKSYGIDNSINKSVINSQRLLKSNNYLFRFLTLTYFIFAALISVNAQNDTILVSFGGSDSQANWNNITDPTAGSISKLINSKGDQTTIGITINDSFNGINSAGTSSPDPSTGFPAHATSHSFYGNTAVFSGKTEPTGGFILEGLDMQKAYTIVFFSSRTGVDDNREAKFIISGSTTNTLYLNASKNTSSIVSSTCNPSVPGSISVTVSPGPNNTNSSGFYYLNALKVIYSQSSTSALDLDASDEKILVYPNPARDEINIKVSTQSEIKIIDLMGKVIQNEIAGAGNNKIKMNLKPGFYFLQVIGTDNLVSTTKLVVK